MQEERHLGRMNPNEDMKWHALLLVVGNAGSAPQSQGVQEATLFMRPSALTNSFAGEPHSMTFSHQTTIESENQNMGVVILAGR